MEYYTKYLSNLINTLSAIKSITYKKATFYHSKYVLKVFPNQILTYFMKAAGEQSSKPGLPLGNFNIRVYL